MNNKNNSELIANTPSKLGLNRLEAASHVGVGATKFDELVDAGTMPNPRPIGSRRIWVRTELELALLSIPVNQNAETNSWES